MGECPLHLVRRQLRTFHSLSNNQPGWTNLWREYQVYAANYGPTVKKLHEKYGPVVRIGPNLLDIDYPEISKVIYGTDGSWIKVRWPLAVLLLTVTAY